MKPQSLHPPRWNEEGDDAKEEIIAKIARSVVGDLADRKIQITINGTGKFLVSGHSMMNTFETGSLSDEALAQLVRRVFSVVS